MSARELRAEARAWRRAAEAEFLGRPAILNVDRTMWDRITAHCEANLFDTFEPVLACLLLEQECLDEARALGRGETSRPDVGR